MIGCFLAPSTDSKYTYPEELRDEIKQVVGEYMVDVPNFRTDQKDRILRDINEMTDAGSSWPGTCATRVPGTSS